MRTGAGVECLQSESRFRQLLEKEVFLLRQDLSGIRGKWEEFSHEPEIPRLPRPFEDEHSLSAGPVRVPEVPLSDVDILSLDIFDTCLRRISGEPGTVFEMLEREMATSGQPCGGFAGKRIEAENRLRKRLQESGEREDVRLGDIYDELADWLGWETAVRRRWESREKALEEALAGAVEPVRKLALRAREAGVPVIYISEMYLPAEVLEVMLKEAGFPVAADSVFASGAVGLSKGSGRLYEWVCDRFPGKKILHLGDNPETDAGIPDRFGISSRLVEARKPEFDDPLSNMLAEISSIREGTADFWRELGHRVAGPLAVGWMMQVLRTAQPLEQILFLTRDGYFPGKVFDTLAPLLGVAAVGRTCFSSRRLLGLAAMDHITALDWEFLLKPAPGFRIRDFFERIGVGPDVYLPVCRADSRDPDAIVCHHRGFHDPRTKDCLYRLFVEVMDAFYPVRDGIRERVLAYLQSLSFPDRRTGIVDIGWNGSSFGSLERLCGDGAVNAGFYLALWESRQSAQSGTERLHPYFISGPNRPAEERLIRGGVGLLEFIMGSPHGSVMDLRYEDEAWKPVYSDPDIMGPYERRAYAGIEEGLDEFLQLFVKANGHLASGDGKAFLRQALERLVYDPRPEEISRLGAVSHVEGWGSGNRHRLLPDMERLVSRDQVRLAYAYSGWKGAWNNLEFA